MCAVCEGRTGCPCCKEFKGWICPVCDGVGTTSIYPDGSFCEKEIGEIITLSDGSLYVVEEGICENCRGKGYED